MKQRLVYLTLAAASNALGQSSVTVYGVVDVFAQALDASSRLVRLQSGGNSGSRLGFRGEEDLGGGLRATFVLESGINVDEGTIGFGGAFYGRQAYLGLQGRWGQLSLGRQYGSLFAATADFSIFSSTPSGPSTAVIGGFGGYEPVRGASNTATPPAAGATGNGGPVRVNNSLRFAAPSWSGFSASLLWGAGEVAGASSDARLVDLGIRFDGSDGFHAMLSVVADKALLGSVRANDVMTSTLAATYSASAWKLAAGFLDVNDRLPSGRDGRGYWVGGQYASGRYQFKAQWVRNEPRYGRQNKTSAIGLGAVYAMSKRTALYTSLTRFGNESRAGNADLGRFNAVLPTGVTTAGDHKLTEFVVGMRQSF